MARAKEVCRNAVHSPVRNMLRAILTECLEEANQLDPVFEEHGDDVVDSKGRFKQIFYNKLTHLFAFFSFVYIGVEVMIGGESLVLVNDNHSANRFFIKVGLFLTSLSTETEARHQVISRLDTSEVRDYCLSI